MLAGDAGIGKTRLAEQVAAHATARGARVAWGRCWESGAPAFWPWVQVVRAILAAGVSPPEGPAGGLITELVQGPAPAAPGRELDQARFRLFDATALLLTRAAAEQPWVVALEDLHAADHSSLLLLRFVARELRTGHVLVVGTYRELEAARDTALG